MNNIYLESKENILLSRLKEYYTRKDTNYFRNNK